jgi:hypothetical protein
VWIVLGVQSRAMRRVVVLGADIFALGWLLVDVLVGVEWAGCGLRVAKCWTLVFE